MAFFFVIARTSFKRHPHPWGKVESMKFPAFCNTEYGVYPLKPPGWSFSHEVRGTPGTACQYDLLVPPPFLMLHEVRARQRVCSVCLLRFTLCVLLFIGRGAFVRRPCSTSTGVTLSLFPEYRLVEHGPIAAGNPQRHLLLNLAQQCLAS